MSALRLPILGHMTGGSSGEHHLDFEAVDTSKTEDALRAAETACQLAIQQLPQEVEVSQALLRYPEGEGDAVTITERDMEQLQPGKFLGDNIVDFYIRFLERSLPPEHRNRFYFFNSFFFRKLSQSAAPTRIDPCKVDYEQVRRWTEKVNLFEKDFVFIPILESSHWSLIILCHLSSLTRAPDKMMSFPCMVHLDPIEGQHGSFEGLFRSFVLQAWMERFEPSIDKDQLLALYQMKYVEVEVPQQSNSHDCGVYVLDYIESFLVKSTSPNFSFALSEWGVYFTYPHFAAEVLGKRMYIKNLLLELIQVSQEHTRKCIAMKNLVQELLQASQNLRFFLNQYHEGYSEANPSISNDEGCEITYVSNLDDSMDVQHRQSTLKSTGNIGPLSGPHVGLGFVKYEKRSESPKHPHVELGMQTFGPVIIKGSIFEAKHVPTHEDSINVQHPDPSKRLRSDYEELDGLELQHAKYQRVAKSFSSKVEETPCLDLSQALKGKNKRGKNMTHEETSVLLLCKVEGGQFCKGSGGATHWNLISEEIEKKLGSRPSADQCRLRYDTLLKAYKTYHQYCMKTGKMFSMITKEERLDLKLTTTLCEEWYTTIGEICDKAKSRKRGKINPIVCNDLHSLSSHDSPSPAPISNGRSFKDRVAILDSVCGTGEVASCNLFGVEVFSSLSDDLQSTLLNLVQHCSRIYLFLGWWNEIHFDLEQVCRRLATLQDHEPREILNYVLKLWELKLVYVADMDFEEGKDLVHIDLLKERTWYLNIGVYEEISKEVLAKNLHLKTYYSSFPIEQSLLQCVQVLNLYSCFELEHLDLREFPNLRVLAMCYCPQLKLVIGWEVATSLGSIDIIWCSSNFDFPNLKYLTSLRDFAMSEWGLNKSGILWLLSQFSQCTNLRRLEILDDNNLSEIVDVKNLKDLKFLEYLSLGGCSFANIQGLSGLQALKTLDFQFCQKLRKVPGLGCLKGLTSLNMSYSSVEDVVGVGELHLLILLNLHGCQSLNCLPFLGHLKELVYLDVIGTHVKEIPGREDLISLKLIFGI